MYKRQECQSLAVGFSQYFADKLDRIRQSIATSLQQSGGIVHSARQYTGPKLSQLAPTSTDEVRKLLSSTRRKPSPVDVLPTALYVQWIILVTLAYRNPLYRVRLKKMTQHVKRDYSVVPENFCAKFCTIVKEGAVH